MKSNFIFSSSGVRTFVTAQAQVGDWEAVSAMLYSASLGVLNAGRRPAQFCGTSGAAVTVDEEISKLDDNLRRLKIEYDVYFGGGSKKPPADTEWRVSNGMKRVGETLKLNYAQRFRFNAIAQRYAVFSDLWRQKMKVREEGYRRPADAQLGISGLRHEEETAAAKELRAKGKKHDDAPFSIACSDPAHEPEKVKALFEAMAESQRKHGGAKTSSFASFENFVQKKTQEIRRQYGCHSVQYTVEVSNGQVKLKAKAKV